MHHNNDATERRVLYSEMDVSSRRLKPLVNNCTGTSSMLWRNVRASLDGTRDAKDQLDDDIQPHSQRNDIHRWACRRYFAHVHWRQRAQCGGSRLDKEDHQRDTRPTRLPARVAAASRSSSDVSSYLSRATWRPGDLATWRPGDLATWRPGDLASWRPGEETRQG
jgi:hypothetical protein